jgi:hypothetical protein
MLTASARIAPARCRTPRSLIVNPLAITEFTSHMNRCTRPLTSRVSAAPPDDLTDANRGSRSSSITPAAQFFKSAIQFNDHQGLRAAGVTIRTSTRRPSGDISNAVVPRRRVGSLKSGTARPAENSDPFAVTGTATSMPFGSLNKISPSRQAGSIPPVTVFQRPPARHLAGGPDCGREGGRGGDIDEW